MTIMRWVCQAWAKKLPVKVINDTNFDPPKPYLRRYYVADFMGWRLYLHHFVASDPDRGLHDHPWSWSVGFALVGGYEEEALDQIDIPLAVTTKQVRPGRFNVVGRRKFHRVIIAPGMSSWTIFLHAPHNRQWGFLRTRPSPIPNAINITYEQRFKASIEKWWLNAPKGDTLQPVA